MGIELEFTVDRDNTQKIKLSDNASGSWQISTLDTLSRVILVMDGFSIDSNDHPTAFTLDADDGTITFKLGIVPNLPEGIFDSHLIIYRNTEPNGLKWSSTFKTRILP